MHTLDLERVPSWTLDLLHSPSTSHIGPLGHGSLELCLLIPEPIHPFTHLETIKWLQWLLGPNLIGTPSKGRPAGIGLNDENYCAQKESIGAFQCNSILFTKGLSNLKMEMRLCLECVVKRWQKKHDSLHGNTPAPKDTTPFKQLGTCLTNHGGVQKNSTKVGSRFQPITAMWVGCATPPSLHTIQGSPTVTDILNGSLLTCSQATVL